MKQEGFKMETEMPIEIVEPSAETKPEVLDTESMARVGAMQRLLQYCVTITSPFHWLRWGRNSKTAYLRAAGAEWVARNVGITWDWSPHDLVKEEKEDSYNYLLYGRVLYENPRLGIRINLPVMGACSSKDNFVCKTGARWKAVRLDENDIRKKTIKNFIRNAVCTILGLNDLPMDVFPKAFWMQIEVVDEPKKMPESKEHGLRKAIVDTLLDICGGDQDASRQMLYRMTTYVDRDGNEVQGVTDTRRLRGKYLQVTYGKILREWQSWKRAQKKK